jgi:hypothetical protein
MELIQMETSKSMEVMGCVDAKDRDHVSEEGIHIVVEQRERKEVVM